MSYSRASTPVLLDRERWDDSFLAQLSLSSNAGVIFFMLKCTEQSYMILSKIMNSISVNKFRDNLKTFVEQVFSEHEPLKVTRRNGEDFVVLSADDWEREQETLYVLQNTDLMKQIATSINTYEKKKGYQPTSGEINEILDL